MSLINLTQILQVVNTPLVAKTTFDDLTDERKTTFEVDPLACSVAFHRKNIGYGLSNTKEDTEEEDFLKAAKIREYYSKKYFWNSLKSNIPQSEFRSNAMRLLAMADKWELTDKDCGFFVKLPAFYEEDIVYDKFKATLSTSKDLYIRKGSAQKVQKKLTYLGKTFRWQRLKRESFWFKDSDNHLYSYTTTHGHPFNNIFEDQIQTPRMFEFNHGVDNIVDMWYNNIGSFTILKEQNA